MNKLSTIAAAVTSALNAAIVATTLPLPAGVASLTVQRRYLPPDYDTAATRELQMLVVAHEEDVDLATGTRAGCQHDYPVKIAMTKQLAEGVDPTSAAALAELDGLSDFRELVIDFLKANGTQGDGQLVTIRNTAGAYNPAQLNENKTFVSVVTATYRLYR